MGERQELQDVLLILLKFELGEKRQSTVYRAWKQMMSPFFSSVAVFNSHNQTFIGNKLIILCQGSVLCGS